MLNKFNKKYNSSYAYYFQGIILMRKREKERKINHYFST